jgi:hypothetical protein
VQVTRRKFFGLTAAGSAAVVATTQTACAAPSHQDQAADATGWTDQQAPGFYRSRVGDFRVTVLSDGTAPRDLPNIMSKPAEVRAALDAAHETLPVQLSINCFVIDTGSKKIMVDTGAGELFGPTSGKLVDNMRAAGYRPEDIDTILLTTSTAIIRVASPSVEYVYSPTRQSMSTSVTPTTGSTRQLRPPQRRTKRPPSRSPIKRSTRMSIPDNCGPSTEQHSCFQASAPCPNTGIHRGLPDT